MKVHKCLSEEEAKILGLPPKKRREGDRKPRYYITPEQDQQIKELRVGIPPESIGNAFVMSAIGKDGTILNLDDYCTLHGLPREDVKSYKLVTHTGTPFYNIHFKEQNEVLDIEEIDFDEILSKYLVNQTTIIPKAKPSEYVDRLIYTDTHIGMTTNENGYSLYGGKWDEIEQERRFDEMISKVLHNKNSDTIYVDDLADFLDGWDGKTTRKGHDLPQNMDNEKAFDVGLGLKMKLSDVLAREYHKVIFNNVCVDNHAGSFGYVLNSAFKSICSAKYKNVEVNNRRRFISHYTIGRHCFILCHGKDDKSLKFGFKPHIDPKQIEKISDYIRINKIKDDFIEFSKGDSHQMLFDYSSSDLFDYFNYGALAPSSEWIMTNFKIGKSSFVIQHINVNREEKIIKPFYFDWNE